MNELLISLAVWRVTSLLVNESGPFQVFERLRQSFNGPFNCFWCMSIWISLPFAIAFNSQFIFYTLVYSAIAIVIEGIVIALNE